MKKPCPNCLKIRATLKGAATKLLPKRKGTKK